LGILLAICVLTVLLKHLKVPLNTTDSGMAFSVSCMNLGDTDYRRISRIYGSANDGLQGIDQLGSNTIASLPKCGIAAWVACPVMVISKQSNEPSLHPIHGKMAYRNIWKIVHAKTQSAGNFSNNPSSIICLAPARPSSAG